MKSTDPARFESIRRAIEQRLKTAQGDGDLVQALEAIGNLGPADVPERVREACTDEREHVRIAAVHALLRVDDANADRQLKKAAYTDASPAVRAEALETVVRRHASGFGNEGGLGGTVAEFLNEFASIEPTPELKRRAEEMLGAVRS